MADALTQAEQTSIQATTAALPTWGKVAVAVGAVVASVVLGFLMQRAQTPTVVKEIGHDPAEDQWDKDYAAAKAAGLVADAGAGG